MNDKYVSLIIANMFLVGAFIVDNYIEWGLLCFIGVFWMFNYLMQEYLEIKNKKRMIMRMEIIHEILHEIMENHKRSEKKSTRRKR